MLECGGCASGACQIFANRCSAAPCQPESDDWFCRRLNGGCTPLTATDGCGNVRTVVCSACPKGSTCAADGGCVFKTDGDFDIDVQAVPLKGHLLRNGVAPWSCAGFGLQFSSTGLGRQIWLDSTCSFETALSPGHYEVILDSRGPEFPNGTLRLGTADIENEGADLTFDLKTVSATFEIRLTDVSARECPGFSGTLYLTDRMSGYSVLANATCSKSALLYDLEAPPGTYDVRVVAAGATSVSATIQADLDHGLALSTNRQWFQYSVGISTVQGQVLLDGRPAPFVWMPGVPDATVLFAFKGTAAEVPFSSSNPGQFTTSLSPGIYDVVLKTRVKVGSLEPGEYVLASALQVRSSQVLLLQPEIATISASLTRAGQTIPCDGFTLEMNRVGGYRATTTLRCQDGKLEGVAAVGTYDLRVSHSEASGLTEVASRSGVFVTGATNVNFELETFTVSGHLEDRGGLCDSGAPRPEVGFMNDFANVYAQVRTTCSNGNRFKVQLPAGDYSVEVNGTRVLLPDGSRSLHVGCDVTGLALAGRPRLEGGGRPIKLKGRILVNGAKLPPFDCPGHQTSRPATLSIGGMDLRVDCSTWEYEAEVQEGVDYSVLLGGESGTSLPGGGSVARRLRFEKPGSIAMPLRK